VSIFKPTGSAIYCFDFQRGSRRFSGSTGETDKARARAFERTKILEAEKLIREQRETGRRPMTVDDAFTKYADEVLTHLPSRAAGERELHWLETALDPDMALHDLTNAHIADVTAMRRACMKPSGYDEKGRRLYKPVAPGTVNRTLECLRAALYHARDVHEAMLRPGLKIKKLVEPDAIVREATGAQEAAIFAALREDYHDVVEFALLSGIRLDGVVTLIWANIDFEHRTIRYRRKRKRGQGEAWATLPMTQRVEAILRRQRGYHRTHVWTFVAQGRGGKGGTLAGREFEAGKRYPITYWNLRTRWQRALAKAGIKNFRFHDLRHTSATRTLRATGNLALVQDQLDHASPTTTRKYAHVLKADLLAGMERAQATAAPRDDADRAESQGKSQGRPDLKVVG
jgi:integrase